jgi:hypothetical protein
VKDSFAQLEIVVEQLDVRPISTFIAQLATPIGHCIHAAREE